MAPSLRLAAIGLAALLSAGCAQAPPAVSNTPTPTAAATADAAVEGSASGGAAPTVAAPDPTTISFNGLPQGAFPVHLHAACNATQAYHLSVLAPLVVDGGGSGAISVPAADLAHGWCAIVYSDGTLTRVLAERPL